MGWFLQLLHRAKRLCISVSEKGPYTEVLNSSSGGFTSSGSGSAGADSRQSEYTCWISPIGGSSSSPSPLYLKLPLKSSLYIRDLFLEIACCTLLNLWYLFTGLVRLLLSIFAEYVFTILQLTCDDGYLISEIKK